MSLDPATVIRRMGVVSAQVASQAMAMATAPFPVMRPVGAVAVATSLAGIAAAVPRHDVPPPIAESPACSTSIDWCLMTSAISLWTARVTNRQECQGAPPSPGPG